jgi:hypothetical protein
MDDYAQVARDFAPFYQLAARDPRFFRKMVEKAAEMVRVSSFSFLLIVRHIYGC